MAKYNMTQKNKVYKKIKKIGKAKEKDILNLKVKDLKKIKELDKFNFSELEIIWLMQEAIEKERFIEFITDTEIEVEEINESS